MSMPVQVGWDTTADCCWYIIYISFEHTIVACVANFFFLVILQSQYLYDEVIIMFILYSPELPDSVI